MKINEFLEKLGFKELKDSNERRQYFPTASEVVEWHDGIKWRYFIK